MVLSEKRTINQVISPPEKFPNELTLRPFSASPTCRIVDTKAFHPF